MSIDELEDHARKQSEDFDIDFMTLVMPKRGKRPPKFPRGELLCVHPDGTQLRRYSIKRILAWCKWARSEIERMGV